MLKQKGATVFPNPEALPKDILEQLPAVPYKTPLAQSYDLSWQAIQKGWIEVEDKLTHIEPLSIQDNYQFIRAYFNAPWVWYVLGIRLLSFKNPFTELSAFFKSRHTPKASLFSPIIAQPNLGKYKLLEQPPLVTVVIPTLNRYPYLKDVLTDLELQDYPNFEVIVVDQTESFQEAFYNGWNLNLQVIYQKEKALWLARNTAIKQSQGEYILLFDDDSRVETDWITNHIKCLQHYNADVSSGVSISKVGAKVPKHYSFFRVSDQLDTGNAMIKKDVFRRIGLFDRQFEKQRMGDGEFGARVHINGCLNVSNPKAKRLHLKVNSGGLRDMGSWDAFRTKRWLDARPVPSVLYFYRRYFGKNAAILALIKNTPLSIMPYRFKNHKYLTLLGMFLMIFMTPLILFQLIKSWRLSSKKIKQGPLIAPLD
ncbi:glycosyltransferase family 2 protein [Mangrovimonas spongiae]|uniref:glycosyltransferase family 2 protein n=1 Tax=Mangrovimonas spongiae TaxID=2494697 RepID=UPI001F0BB1E2|nr:glycosyltransferase family A protein [Mangrovimonas spongiae]